MNTAIKNRQAVDVFLNMIYEQLILSGKMTVVNLARYRVMLWIILEMFVTSQRSEGKALVTGTLESPLSVDDTNNLYLPSSQQNTGVCVSHIHRN